MFFEGRKVDRYLVSGRVGIGECMREFSGGNVWYFYSFVGFCYFWFECWFLWCLLGGWSLWKNVSNVVFLWFLVFCWFFVYMFFFVLFFDFVDNCIIVFEWVDIVCCSWMIECSELVSEEVEECLICKLFFFVCWLIY